MVKKFGLFIVLLFVSMASASGISWKTFDIKFGPSLGGWHDESTTMFGGMLSIVKPLTPYIGVGVMAEIATDASGCEDCVDYDFNELSEGILVNLIAPLGRGFSLTANFMFLVNFQDGTVEGHDFYAPKPIEAYDAEGNRIDVYKYMRETNNLALRLRCLLMLVYQIWMLTKKLRKPLMITTHIVMGHYWSFLIICMNVGK